MATNKMNQIVNNTNMEIYKAKARTIFNEASKALANNELTIEDLLKLDLEFDKAVMGVVECEKKKAKLNNEEVKNKRLLDIARDIVYGEDDECDEECENEEDDTDDNSHVNEVFGMVFGAFGF
jgi:hypothetical protein